MQSLCWVLGCNDEQDKSAFPQVAHGLHCVRGQLFFPVPCSLYSKFIVVSKLITYLRKAAGGLFSYDLSGAMKC